MTHNASHIDDYMHPPDWQRCTEEQLWHYAAWHLENAGISSVLVGGAAVVIHTEGRYRTTNLDLVPDDFMRREIAEILRGLGFGAPRNRNFVHPECPHLSIRFPMAPVEIGGDLPGELDEVEVHGRRLRLLSPTDCVNDRLAGYVHQGSRTFFDQAVLVCIHQPARVDLERVERWCEGNGSIGAFKELKRRLMDIENERFFPGLHPQSGVRPTIFVFARQLQSAHRILMRLGFERLKPAILTHVLVTLENGTMTLAVTDGVHWLESRIPNSTSPNETGRFLIPAKALGDAARSGTGKLVLLNFSDGPGKPMLLVTICGRSTQTRTFYPTEPAAGFPDRPVVGGHATPVPKETLLALQTVAVCASRDVNLNPRLCGVLFDPCNGGAVVATDGRQLACAPAHVPAREFILPNTAVQVLDHPEFVAGDVDVLLPESPEDLRVGFRSGLHTFIARTVPGSFPDYRRIIPDLHDLPGAGTIPEIHRAALISWLRSLKRASTLVRLTWENPGHLTLTHIDDRVAPEIMEIPVNVAGDPPPVSLCARFLANALVIGSTIRLRDRMTPCLVTAPSGNCCVLVPEREADDLAARVAEARKGRVQKHGL